MYFGRIAVILLFVFFLVQTAWAQTPIFDLMTRNIQNNEKVSVEYASSGCWHMISSAYEINAKGIVKDGVLYEISWKDFEKIDEVIEGSLYINTDRWCTTRTSYTLTKYRNEQVIARRSFADNACSVTDIGNFLDELIAQQEKQSALPARQIESVSTIDNK